VEDGRLLAALEDALARLEVEVRVEPFAPEARRPGGLVRLRGTHVVFVGAHASVAERIDVLAKALRALDTAALFLPPAVRARIDGA
jgi:hypothetical protein